MATTRRAFEAAMLDFMDKLKGHSFYDQIIQTTSIEQVYQDIEKLQDKQAKSGRLRHLSKIELFLTRLREYSSVVETFMQAKPDILALIWGPIKLLWLWADVLKQSFDALVNALEEIGNALPDFCELAEMFADNNRLQELLVLYFRDILQFYLISTKFFSMRRKTLLASSVIKHTQSLDGTHTVFAFLTYLDSHISALSILQSLIFQLASTSLPLKTILCQSNLQHLGSDFNVASALLQTLIQSAGVVHLIVDGLDEVEPVQRSRLIKELLRLSGDSEECHILLTSRAESDISRDLDGKTTDVQVDKDNAGSIQAFIDQTIGEWFKERGFVPDIQHQIRGWAAPLASRAKGMFLYVKVILRIIYYINDIGDIQNQLEHLPTSLEDAYGRVLQQINASPDPQRRNLARSILGWVGCAPSTMTLKEIEQALLVDPDCPCKLPRVQARVNVIQICGPIIDVVDGYVQFVHFTVREYIFSTKIQNSITLSETALDLTIRCVVYMCQDHHDPDLTEDEIDANMLWGAYRLHHFSSSFWLDLINEYLTLSGSETIPHTLIDQLRILLETRSSDHYTQSNQSKRCLHPAILGLEDQEPALVEMLKGCIEFQTSSSKSDFRINNPEQWFHTSPLSIPKISIALHERLDGLEDRKLSILNSVSYHYGPKYFRCGFLGCYYNRYGFETKTSRQAHERNHQKPWKCNLPGCRFATQGFISRKMRDDHLKNGHSHAANPGLSSTSPPPKIEDEELQPLIFDLIETNRMEIITPLMPRLRNLDRYVQMEMAIHAAKVASHEILQLFNDSGLLTGAFLTKDGLDGLEGLDWERLGTLAKLTVGSGSIGLSKILLCWVATLHKRVNYAIGSGVAVKKTFRAIMELESEDIFELWKPILASGFGIEDSTVHVTYALSVRGTISTTNNIPSRERMLLGIWEVCRIPDTMKPRDRNKLLRDIADNTCSVNLARYAIQHGCEVDGKAHENSPTALQFAARKTTQQAADLMKFLLLQGADPNMGAAKNKGSAKIMIRDEKGAREISKWLELTWEELVERTNEELQRIKGKEGSHGD
ncbi:hypothetical protein ACKAV7_008454 [Fusarium commune]